MKWVRADSALALVSEVKLYTILCDLGILATVFEDLMLH